MPKLVLDASAVIELLLGTGGGAAVRERIWLRAETLHAPHLLDVEVVHVLRRYAAAGEIDHDRGTEALRDLYSLDIERYAHEIFLHRVWALRHNLTGYDAIYVSLAEALGATLLTFDAKLAKASGHEARIELLRSR